MKILFVSNRNPYFTNTNIYREEALRALGHEVTFMDTRERVIHPRLLAMFPVLQQWSWDRLNQALVRQANTLKPGLCLVVGGVPLRSQTVGAIRKLGIPVILWTSDAPFPDMFARILAAAQAYTAVYCAGTEAVSLLVKAGRRDATWLPFAADAERHAPVVLTPRERQQWGRDIAFVGSYYPNRARVLGSLADLSLGIWGPLWDRLPAGSSLEKKVQADRIDVSTWVKIYTAAKIIVVIHYEDGKTPCDQASPKLFEALACGAFVLCDRQKDARALFRDGEQVVFFKDAEDLRVKVLHYLGQPAERARIAAAGRAEVLQKHTWQLRMAVITKRAG